jgi:urease accessory protein
LKLGILVPARDDLGRASSLLLSLADGRFPAGGHAHSGGLEEVVADGRASTIEDLQAFLVGRLCTAGRVDATLAAFSWLAAPSPGRLADVHAEAVARWPSPAQRDSSRAQGRALLRAARNVWPTMDFGGIAEVAGRERGGPVYAVVLGAVGKGIGLDLKQVALVVAQSSVSGPAWASTRLLGLDPFAVARSVLELAPAIDTTATSSVVQAQVAFGHDGSDADLAACAAPLLEIGAERHAQWEVRLFAS